MKRLFLCAIPLALLLSGCHKAAPGAPPTSRTGTAPEVRTDAAPISRVPIAFTPQTGNRIAPEEVPLLEQINRENIKVLAAVMPGIVRITANRQADPRMRWFGKDSPFQFHFGPDAPRDLPSNEPSYGSGIIISKDGYIVTNAHVIEDAEDVKVELQDKRSLRARFVTSDAALDLAVLKIDATDLTALPWGDSDKVQVGEQVFALGDPFNLEDSASKGIVSATERNLPDSPNETSYLQTDAAINPGNSGGALINIHGELIGINTAIASMSRGNEGVGFAIPSNFARRVVEYLLNNERGYLGVVFPEKVDDGVLAQFDLKTIQGALLADIRPDSPAEKGGLHSGDFITAVDGHKIGNSADLRLVVSQLSIGKEVTVNFIRGGAPQSTTVKIIEFPRELLTEAKAGDKNESSSPTVPNDGQAHMENVLSGLQVSDLNDKSRQKFGVDAMVTAGVVVSDVQEGSMADAKGIERGDVIESAGVSRGSPRQLAGAKDFDDVTQTLKPDQSVVLLVHHGKAPHFVYLAPEK